MPDAWETKQQLHSADGQVEIDGCTADCTVDCGRCKGKPFRRVALELARLRRREVVWMEAVFQLYDRSGAPPDGGSDPEPWFELFDEAMTEAKRDGRW